MATGRVRTIALADLMARMQVVLPTPQVRGVIDSNISNLASFTVASRDGLT